jgi:anti-sigma regulatory factor (Ser/Thr protein kinase)
MSVDSREFVHPALFYRGLDEYLTGVGGFVRNGLAAGEPVFVSVPPDRLEPLREHLGPDARRVDLHDMSQVGRNPGRILTALADFAERRGDRRAWLVGEPIWAGRSAAEIREATRHEALINLAFAGAAVTVLCPYDVSALSAATLANAERTHPVLWGGGREWSSSAYADPLVINADCDAPEEREPVDAVRMSFGPAEIGAVRRCVKDFGRSAGLTAARAVDLKLAAGEAVANSIRHGGGAGKLSMWSSPDGAVVVEVRDSGRLDDPLSGRLRPPFEASNGRGLWLMHQLCDLVELGTGVVRLHVRE